MSKRRKKRVRTRHKPIPDPHFSIWESEVRFIAGTSIAWPELETGGHLYGLWTASGRAVVAFASGPGPNATHQATHFAQDVDYFRQTTRILRDEYGLQLVGPWHSHHRLGLDKPSGGDEQTTKSLSRRNNLTRLVEILVNHVPPQLPSPSVWGMGRTNKFGTFVSSHRTSLLASKVKSPGNTIVKVNSFHHHNPQAADYQRCPIRVIPGISPIRLMMITRGLLGGDGLGHDHISFPMSRIQFESAGDLTERSDRGGPESGIPAVLATQLDDLPVTIRKDVTAVVADEIVMFELPTSGTGSIQIAFDRKPPHKIRAVCRKAFARDELDDITAEVLTGEPRATMGRIYDKLARGAGFGIKGLLTCGASAHEDPKSGLEDTPKPNPNLAHFRRWYERL